ncbi:MAG TPA: hypothetical protein VER33_01775 [Polyangiaceae bacterium]|nr:hypothetical protein [Polyangiaceae bacterium]
MSVRVSIQLLQTACFLAACSASPRPPQQAPPPALAAAALQPVSPVLQQRVVAELAFTGSLPEIAAVHAGPLTFEAAAPDGSWVVLCQARQDTNADGHLSVSVSSDGSVGGDRLSRYLVRASGEEEPIDDYLAGSADGRFVVVQRAGQSELIDLLSGARQSLEELGADTLREPHAQSAHRSLVFHGEYLLYVRSGRESQVVERHLGSGAERVIHAGSEPVVRVRVEGQPAVRIISVVVSDSNGNGRLDMPFRGTSAAKPCRLPIARYMAPPLVVDGLGHWLLDPTSGAKQRIDDLVGVFADAVVRRPTDGSLWLERQGLRVLLGSVACAGRLLWGNPSRQQLLLGCSLPRKPGRLAVESLARAKRATLGVDVAALGVDEPIDSSERLVALYPGADAVLYDAELRALHRLQPRDAVLAQWAARALVRRGRQALLFDAELQRELDLGIELDPMGEVLRKGPLVSACPWVVDLEAGRVLGSVPGRALALSTDGRVLLPVTPPSATALAQGPLSWHEPR